MENGSPTPVHDSPCLRAFQGIIASEPPEVETCKRLMEALEKERHLEQAYALLKQRRPDPKVWGGVLALFKEAISKTRERRMNLWQVDPERRTLRLCFEVRGPACGQHPPALVASLGRLFLDSGLPLAMGLEKNPRPVVALGHPLPLDVEGYGEWADVGLQEGPPWPPEDLPGLINAQAPEGLKILQCQLVPNYSTPISDLCHRGNWRWACPESLLASVRERMAAFEASDRFEIEMQGKVGGQKCAKLVDVRPLLGGLAWDGPCFTFQTRMGSGQATNPRKVLAGILGILPEAIQQLSRTSVELREDRRLKQADRFLPKLHNMFEDAVLLTGGSNIRIIEDDDEAPLILG